MAQPFSIKMTKEQADLMLLALEEKLARETGDEAKLALIYSIECILSSGIAHSKER